MFLSIKDLSQYLQIKPSTLYAWASKGIIPHYKVHGLLRFKQDEIDTWIASFRKEKLAPHIPSFKRRDQDDIDSLIERAKVRHIKSCHVFYNINGNRIEARYLLRAFYSATKKAKLGGLRFHDLRHTFATRLVQAGVDLYAVQKLGRWKTLSMVNRYAHHYPESLRAGVEVLDRVAEKISTNLAQSSESETVRVL